MIAVKLVTTRQGEQTDLSPIGERFGQAEPVFSTSANEMSAGDNPTGVDREIGAACTRL